MTTNTPSGFPGGTAGPRFLSPQVISAAAYTLQGGDDYLVFTNGAAVTLTVPPDVPAAAYPSNPLPIGTTINFTQNGAGTVSVVAGAGVTILSLNGSLSISGRYGVGTLVKEAANTWKLFGALA